MSILKTSLRTALLATGLLLSLTAAHAQSTKLRIGVEGAYPPFSQMGTDGKIQGFDIDIANALCAQMKVECQLVVQDFDGMIPALQARKFDAIVASMSITEERLKSVDFSDKYYKTPNRFVAKKGAKFEFTPAGLKGKKIGVQRATVNDRYVSDVYKDATIVRYAKQDEAYLDLTSGRVDLIVVDAVAGQTGFLKKPQGAGYGFVGPELVEEKYFGKGVGIAMRKGDANRAKWNEAIKAIRSNGVYKKLQDKYFDFDIYGGTPAAK